MTFQCKGGKHGDMKKVISQKLLCWIIHYLVRHGYTCFIKILWWKIDLLKLICRRMCTDTECTEMEEPRKQNVERKKGPTIPAMQ